MKAGEPTGAQPSPGPRQRRVWQDRGGLGRVSVDGFLPPTAFLAQLEAQRPEDGRRRGAEGALVTPHSGCGSRFPDDQRRSAPFPARLWGLNKQVTQSHRHTELGDGRGAGAGVGREGEGLHRADSQPQSE